MKNTRLKKAASVILTAAMLVFPMVARAGYAPERQTYTYGPDFKGADHVQFNSIVNNPSYGDERYFFTGRDNSIQSGGWGDPVNNVQPGKEYLLRIFVHNNANQGLNDSGKGVAKDTKVKVTLPTNTGTNLVATAAISASNATPGTVTDTLNFKSASGVNLSYVPGSAEIDTAYKQGVKLSDTIVTSGATVGSEALNGNWKGCFGYAGFVYLRVKATAPAPEKPAVSIVKTASSTNVAPGDKVNYTLTVTNNSKADAKNVTVRDALPTGVTVSGATLTLNGGSAQGIANYQQLFSKDGMNIGTVKAGNKAVIVVSATVGSDATGKDCSVNLQNTAYVHATDVAETSSSVTVKVSKDCQETPTTPTLPDTGAEGAAAAALGTTGIGVGVQAYIRSKRGLAKALRNNR